MAISEKGKKGFQNINIEDKKSVRVSSYLTEKESSLLKEYCSKNDLKASILVREYLLSLLSK
tara:strand:- start:237 stop:422 length:186 start_codon:yes stop_codon:yes gene_type:complete